MLKTLEHVPQEKIEDALSNAAALLLPTPEEEPSFDEKSAQVGRDIISEVRKRLRIRDDDASDSSLGRIQEAISNEIISFSLTPERSKEARFRLGQRGILRANLYDVEFAQLFFDVSGKLGATRSHVEEAIRSPDGVDHVFPDEVGGEIPYYSIYVKRIQPTQGDSFVWIIQTERKGDTQIVHLAWRAYDSDVALVGAERPREMLSQFLQSFGLDFQIGNSAFTRMIFYERFPDPPGFRLNAFLGKTLSKFVVGSVLKRLRGEVVVALAYAVNIDLYVASLQKHGVFSTF